MSERAKLSTLDARPKSKLSGESLHKVRRVVESRGANIREAIENAENAGGTPASRSDLEDFADYLNTNLSSQKAASLKKYTVFGAVSVDGAPFLSWYDGRFSVSSFESWWFVWRSRYRVALK
jgi:hypothetical protein